MVRLIDTSLFPDHISENLFQFQYGSIDSLEESFSSFHKVLHFNSSMVRLIDRRLVQKSVIQYNFNSSMVRLIGDYTSTTKTFSDFNSSMVRLIVQLRFIRFSRLHHFNSSMVRLIVNSELKQVKQQKVYFNSSMVRLIVLSCF